MIYNVNKTSDKKNNISDRFQTLSKVAINFVTKTDIGIYLLDAAKLFVDTKCHNR